MLTLVRAGPRRWESIGKCSQLLWQSEAGVARRAKLKLSIEASKSQVALFLHQDRGRSRDSRGGRGSGGG